MYYRCVAKTNISCWKQHAVGIPAGRYLCYGEILRIISVWGKSRGARFLTKDNHTVYLFAAEVEAISNIELLVIEG